MSPNSGLLELVGEVFHDALRDRVRDRVDLGEDSIKGRHVIVPSLVKSSFNLSLCQSQVLMEQVKHVVLRPVRVRLTQKACYLVSVHCPLTVLRLKILLVSSLGELDEIDAQEDVFPQEFCKFPSRSFAIVGHEGAAYVIRSFQ